MGKYRNYAKLYKYFGIGYLDLQELSWKDYICTLSVALDLDEIDEYRWWVNSQLENPKKGQKWKWQTLDKAGTLPPVKFQWEDFAKELQVAQQGKDGRSALKKVPIEDIKRVNDRPILYIDNNRVLWTQEGELYLDLKAIPPEQIAERTRPFMVLKYDNQLN